jgi:hypothetical protein
MIVIDVGAQHHPPEESTYFLADHFHPEKLYAFDIGRGYKTGVEQYKGTKIVRERVGAWVDDQGMAYTDNGMCSGINSRGEGRVETFDLAEFIRNLGGDLVVKLDCEGAEYVICPHLVNTGVDQQIGLLLVEWHPPHLAHGWYTDKPTLACKVVDLNDLTGLPTEAERYDPSTS